eukprot:CAMPEP_0182600640 /NCGR_PEP_ID=MMETSP1324-20130603/91075_1 /TAXON_ID=236786 /ORGANISM="Florenciella sp., Strain RCC1587" /LENGTH=171 /DNA_ID=CAMNT_0024818547 /DNA_START=742 /DNA_END=1258 /DNA_ORIENTATION=-
MTVEVVGPFASATSRLQSMMTGSQWVSGSVGPWVRGSVPPRPTPPPPPPPPSPPSSITIYPVHEYTLNSTNTNWVLLCYSNLKLQHAVGFDSPHAFTPRARLAQHISAAVAMGMGVALALALALSLALALPLPLGGPRALPPVHVVSAVRGGDVGVGGARAGSHGGVASLM